MVDAGEVVLGVDVDDAGGVVVVTPKTHTQLLIDSLNGGCCVRYGLHFVKMHVKQKPHGEQHNTRRPCINLPHLTAYLKLLTLVKLC